MRELKFRAWDKQSNKMCIVSRILNFNDNMHLILYDPHSINELGNNYGADSVRAELMQYTGLTDKNGTDIYDGDIVRYLDGEYSFDAIVKYSEHYWYMDGIRPLDSFDFDDTLPSEVEVIGNIYENQELLNK